MRSHNCTASFSHLPKSFKQPEWSCERHQAQFLFHKWMSSEKMKYLKHTRAKAVPQSQRQSSEGMLRTASLLSEDVCSPGQCNCTTRYFHGFLPIVLHESVPK